MKCPKCKDGELVEKKARRGNFFYGCSNYPKCDFTSATKPVAETCPELRQLISGGKDDEGRHFSGLSEQQGHGAGERQRQEKGGAVELAKPCDYSRRVAPPAEKASA